MTSSGLDEPAAVASGLLFRLKEEFSQQLQRLPSQSNYGAAGGNPNAVDAFEDHLFATVRMLELWVKGVELPPALPETSPPPTSHLSVFIGYDGPRAPPPAWRAWPGYQGTAVLCACSASLDYHSLYVSGLGKDERMKPLRPPCLRGYQDAVPS
eukprot:6189159-Pleurochrysis_carterae.AAC.1